MLYVNNNKNHTMINNNNSKKSRSWDLVADWPSLTYVPAPKLVLRWGEGGSCLSGFCSGKLALSSIRRIFLNGDWDSLRKRVCVCLCVQGCVLGGWVVDVRHSKDYKFPLYSFCKMKELNKTVSKIRFGPDFMVES